MNDGSLYDWFEGTSIQIQEAYDTYLELAQKYQDWIASQVLFKKGHQNERVATVEMFLSGVEAMMTSSIGAWLETVYPYLQYAHFVVHAVHVMFAEADEYYQGLSPKAKEFVDSLLTSGSAPKRDLAGLDLHHHTFTVPEYFSEINWPLGWTLRFDHDWLFKITANVNTSTLFKIEDAGPVKSQYVALTGSIFYISSVYDGEALNSSPSRILHSDGTRYLTPTVASTPFQQGQDFEFSIRYIHLYVDGSFSNDVGRFDYSVNGQVVAWEQLAIPLNHQIVWDHISLYGQTSPPNKYYHLSLQ